MNSPLMKSPAPAHRATRQGRSRADACVLALGLSAALIATPCPAEPVSAPRVDLSGLEVLGEAWREENPYRGNPRAAEVGRSAYSQACARCHGAEALQMGAAADLRLVGLYCKRISDPALQHMCTRDSDDYFRRTVLKGKVRLGVVHMPAWEDVLSQEVIWAIRTFVESQRQQR